MNILIQTNIGESRGVPRFWVEGKRLASAGFKAGQKLAVETKKTKLFLRSAKPGDNGKIITVSERKRTAQPVLELRGEFLCDLFGRGAKIVIKIKNGRMAVSGHHLDQRKKERGAQFLDRLQKGKPLRVASLYHGGGVLDCAIHEGLKDCGIDSYCALASEIESKYIESSLKNNAHLFNDESLILNAPIEELNLHYSSNKLPSIDVLIGGLPCTGASVAGKSKNKIVHAEQHSTAGAQFYSYLQMVDKFNPAVIVLENVPAYKNTASYAVICSVLKTMNYNISERMINGNDFGALENRTRLVMVATCNTLIGFDIESVTPFVEKPKSIAGALDDESLVSGMWKDYSYLREKEKRDKAAGKGFSRQLLTPDAERVPVTGREYNKVRSTEAQAKHPTSPILTRLFTVAEHAKFKTIPERILKGLSVTVAHEVAGQSVIYVAFQALGRAVAKWAGQLISTPVAA